MKDLHAFDSCSLIYQISNFVLHIITPSIYYLYIQVNVTVEAKIVSNEDCQSGDSGSEGYRDALVKPVIVKPEGFPLEETQGEFVCKQTGEVS